MRLFFCRNEITKNTSFTLFPSRVVLCFFFVWPSVCADAEIYDSVGGGKWLMVHPSVILRQAGEYVHFAWFPSSIFQTAPELGVTQLETGLQEKQQHKWKSRPRWYNHFVQHEHFCKHVRGDGGGGQAPRLLCKMRWCKRADWLSSRLQLLEISCWLDL